MTKPWQWVCGPYFRVGAIPPGYCVVFYAFDRDSAFCAKWWIAPVFVLAHWWRSNRWCIERWTAERDPSLLAEGDYYKNHYFHTGVIQPPPKPRSGRAVSVSR